MIKAFLFDLDSTLLQMDQDEFIVKYFHAVGAFAHTLGYNPKEFMDTFNTAAYGIIVNDGTMSNEDRFWSVVEKKYPNISSLKESFTSFYSNEFKALEECVHRTDTPRLLIDYLKSKGYILILATNPVFPVIGTETRVRWAGLEPKLFQEITTYEDCRFCKPNPKYFQDILNQFGLSPEECIMVGNDVDDDFKGLPEGMQGYLITDYMLNRKNKEIPVPAYSMDEFYSLVLKKY